MFFLQYRIIFPKIHMTDTMKKRTSLLFIIIILLTFTVGFTVKKYNSQKTPAPAPSIVAHRGDSAHAPENTLPAFELAIQKGADCIELDVRQTADHVPVVIHDKNMARISGTDCKVSDITFRELVAMDIDDGFASQYKNTHICTLEQAICLCRNRVRLNIDLKVSGLEEEIVSLLQKYNLSGQCEITSGKAQTLRTLKTLDPDIKTLLLMSSAEDVRDYLYGEILSKDRKTYIDGISVKVAHVNEFLVQTAHSRGQSVHVWTVNSEEDFHRVYNLGVDAIITDDPEKAVYYLHYEQ